MTEPDRDKLHFSNRKYRTHLIVSFLTIAILVAAALRLWGIDLRSLADPEINVTAILFALGSIPLIFLIARRVFGSTVGGVAALMLTLHGFHISLSQAAPIHVIGVFLSLLATWLLFLLVRARTPRPWLEAGYITSLIVGALTVEPFWLLILIHLCWAMLVLPWTLALQVGWTRQIGFSKAPRLIRDSDGRNHSGRARNQSFNLSRAARGRSGSVRGFPDGILLFRLPLCKGRPHHTNA